MNFPKRINISLALNCDLAKLAIELNQIIVEDGYSEISFTAPSPHIPHVTLLMGKVAARSDYFHLLRTCKAFAATVGSFYYRISPPYLKPPSQHFIFSDTLPQSRFRIVRRQLHELSGEFLECDHHGGPD